MRQPETERGPHEARRTRGPMGARNRFLFLNLIMIGACAAVMSVMSVVLYRHEVQEKRDMLQVTVQSQARLIEAVARYEAEMAYMMRDEDPDYDPAAAALIQVADAHERYEGFGETGEFTLARRDGDSIVFVLRHRHGAGEPPAPVAFDSELAEPMRRALEGLSGTVIGLDYRGERVLAAHEPVAVLDLGIVAKVDLAEIRAPFIRSALIAAAVALCAVLAGAALFIRIGNPMIVRLEAHAQDLEKEVEERKLAEKALREKQASIEMMQMVAETANEADDVDSALRAILERVCRHTGWPIGHVYTLAEDSSEQLLPTKLWYMEQPERFETFRKMTEETTFGIGIGLPGRVLATRKPAWIVDVSKDPGFLRAQPAQDIGVRSGFGFPILVGTEVAAVLEFYSAETVEPDEPLLEIMAHVGAQLGRVIERKRAEESLMRQQRAISLNHRIANVFLSSPPEEIYANALDVVLEALDSRFGLFGYIDEAGDLVCPTLTHDVWDQCRIPRKSIVFPRAAWVGLWGRSLTERRTMMANEGLRLPEGHVALECALAVPIVHHDTLIGLFVVANRPGGYDEYDRELLESVASQTGPVLNALLEEARQRREHEKLEEQYRQSQKMEAIGTLTGGIAHDFNNILQSLLGFCTLAQDSGLDDRDLLTECLHEIEVGGKRAADMVAQLLAFSRADEVERKLCHVEPAVHEALALIRGSLPSTIEIQTEMAHDCHPVFADVTQIHRIVLNLCTNAGHAMEKDGGVLRVELRNHSLGQETALNSGPLEAGQYVLLTVKDSGPGIMPGDLERLFEPFFTTRRNDGGSGLGLSSVHGIVASLDGGIDVVSKPGEGAQFKVFLPRYRGVETEEAPASPPSDSHRPGPARVLLVDDEAAVARVTALALEKRGYAVEAFTSPEEAIEAFQRAPDGYVIVITDLTMPQVTGIELSQRIHSINAKVPILLATGQLNLDASASHEITEVIKKPFNMDNLVEMIERHCTP